MGRQSRRGTLSFLLSYCLGPDSLGSDSLSIASCRLRTQMLQPQAQCACLAREKMVHRLLLDATASVSGTSERSTACV